MLIRISTEAQWETLSATASVIEGSNSISLINSTVTGATKGALLYQSMSGDASGVNPKFSITGGSFTAKAGPLFYITNASAIITAKGATLSAVSDTIIAAGMDS